MRALAAAAAAAYGARSPDRVVITPGTQILLPRVSALVKPGRALVLGPTYAEHARAAALAGHAVDEVRDLASLERADLAIVVNPNNPDGRVMARADLLDLAARLAGKGGLLVVDEAFMDVGPRDQSVAQDAGRPGLLVLRSFGKFFGLAGVRLGFALAEPAVAARLEAEFGPWAVSGLALEIGLRALSDLGWQATMRERLAAKASRLDGLLQRRGETIAGGTSLFRFLRTRRAPALFDHLGRAGIMVRRFSFDHTALRIGLPGNAAEWRRLEDALAGWPS